LKSGFVSILGRPNAGKSTLLNALIGEKVAIVTPKAQTTRTRIHGIYDVPARKGKRQAAQIVFVDTPGVHTPGTLLDKRMMQEVYDALETRDIVVLIVDATRNFHLAAPSAATSAPSNMPAPPNKVEAPVEGMGFSPSTQPAESGGFRPGARNAAFTKSQKEREEDEFVFRLVRKLDCPVFLLINKIDQINAEKLAPLIAQLSSQHNFAEVIPISATKKKGLDILVEKLIEHLPVGERYFPKDQFTDQPERFMVAELIREKILLETGEEVPYASAVVVEKFEEPPPPPKHPKPLKSGQLPPKLPVTKIAAAIYCEREGQKAILIGKGGAKLKAIGTAARKEIEPLLGTRVFLELFVVVQENWRDSRGFLQTLDWRNQLEEIAKKDTPATLPPDYPEE
jgi:GTP-binding protein Era